MNFKIGSFVPLIVLITAIIIVSQEFQKSPSTALAALKIQLVIVVIVFFLYRNKILDILKIYWLNYKGLKQLNQDLFIDAQSTFEEAIFIGQRDDHVSYKNWQSFNNLGLLYERQGNYPKAIEQYEQALQYHESPYCKAAIYFFIPFGPLLAVLDEVLICFNRYTRENGFVLAVITVLGFYLLSLIPLSGTALLIIFIVFLFFKSFRIRATNHVRQLRTRLQIGELNLRLGKYPEVLKSSQEELKLADKINNDFLKSIVLNNAGLAYFYQEQYSEALQYFEQSKAIHTQTLYSQIDNPPEYGMLLLNTGATFAALNECVKARKYYEQALAIAHKTKSLTLESLALFYLGEIIASEDPTRAIEHYDQVLNRARKMGYRAIEAKTLHHKGLMLFQIDKLDEAEEVIFSAIEVQESLRASELSDADKVTLSETYRNTYNLLQEVLVAQGKTDKALEIAERGRARAFVELLAKRLSPTAGSQAFAHLLTKPPTIGQIRHITQTRSVTLVEYSLISNKVLFVWVIQPSGEINFCSVKLETPQQQQISLSDLVFFTRHSLRVRDAALVSPSTMPDTEYQISFCPKRQISLFRESFDFADQSPLQVLSQLLIDRIIDFLPKQATDLVIFIPHQDLFLVPFAALLDPSGRSLIDSYTLQIAPSIQVLELTQRLQNHRDDENRLFNQPVIVGDPVMPQVTVEGDQMPIPLIHLVGARQEVEAIAGMLNTQALVGEQAAKIAVLQQMPSASLIHLATHGLLNEIRGMGIPGAIALAPDGTGEPNDGLLTASEILELKLQADLVVLSCCNTGLGQITGDGVIGLSRCLFAAGVPSVIVSLWSVADDSTAFLMTEFYRHCLAGQNKAQALRQAMLMTKQRYAEPYHWAAFTLIGEAH